MKRKRLNVLYLIMFILIIALAVVAIMITFNKSKEPAPESAAESTAPVSQATTDSAKTEPTAGQQKSDKLEKILKSENVSLKKRLDAPEMLQEPELPTGCESVALTIALNTLGFDLEKTDIAENYLEYSADFINYAIGYVGDPFEDDGAGVFPPGIVKTVDNYRTQAHTNAYAEDISGTRFEDLYKIIDGGCPVVVWTTMSYTEPNFDGDEITENGFTYRWYLNEHCATLYGYDVGENEVYISDPLNGYITKDADEFEALYNEIGKLAVAIWRE